MGLKNLLPLALAAVLLVPGSAFADRKDGEKQRRERLEREYRDADRRARDGYYRGDYGRAYPGAYGYPGDYGYAGEHGRNKVPGEHGRDKEWRKDQKERDKEAREAWREAEKDRREAGREWLKDQREAEREWLKAEQEAQREWEKDRREAVREREKDRRESRKVDRYRDQPYDSRY